MALYIFRVSVRSGFCGVLMDSHHNIIVLLSLVSDWVPNAGSGLSKKGQGHSACHQPFRVVGP